MKVLLHLGDRIEEYVTVKEYPTPPLDLELRNFESYPFSVIFSLTGKADGLPIYHKRGEAKL